jgi:hypothetical protein
MSNSVGAVRMRWENLRTVAFGSITTSYVALGSPTQNPARQFKWLNGTNADIVLSWDGVNDMDVQPANTNYVSDNDSNKTGPSGVNELAANSILYIKYRGSAPTSGNFDFVVIYGSID